MIISLMLGEGLIKHASVSSDMLKTGRPVKWYQLNQPYETICVGDLAPLLTKVNRHEALVYKLMADVSVSQILLMRVVGMQTNRLFSASKMLGMLFSLSEAHYTRCDDLTIVASQLSHRRTILSALVKTGVVKVKRGYGYKLRKPLEKIMIKQLLPLMYSKSEKKKTYNTLIYMLRDKPVSILNQEVGAKCIKC